jgi:hypothetical protein
MKPQQITQPSSAAGRALWFKWVLTNALVGAMTVIPTFITASVDDTLGATGVGVLNLLLAILIAILVGMLQWLVVRRYVGWANQWWLVTSVGWSVGGFLAPYATFAV